MISQTKSVNEKYSFCNDVRNRVPISITSARLNSAEVGLILRHMGCFTEKDEEQVQVDESTSSYDRQGKKPSMAPKDDASYFVLATTFAPKSIVRFLQTNAKEDDDFKVIPADAILLEVVQDSFRTLDSGTAEDEWDRDDMNIIVSRLLYWPSSIHEYSVFEDDDQHKNDAGNIWMSMLRALTLRTSNTEITDEEKQQQKLLKLKKIKRRIGITGLSISRQTDQSSEQEVDMDEVFGLVDRLGLNVDINLDPDLLTSRTVRNSTESRSCGEEGNLILSCLCNNGRVHVFSLIDLILRRYTERRLEDGILLEHNSFLNGFESFIFGDTIKTSLDENILPLTNPIITIHLSIHCIDVTEVTNQQASYNEENSNKLSSKNERFKNVIMKVEQQIDNYRPRIDFSSLDANIELSTLPDQTVNNIPFLCKSAFDYVVIGGMGDPKCMSTSIDLGSKLLRSRLKGGFVSFISTRYLSEARTVYLPFCPKIISPIVWNTVQFVIVLGHRVDQCVAIRVDSSSNFLHHDHSIDAATDYQHFAFLKKFYPVYISFYGLNEIDASSTFPISVSNASDAVPSIIICAIDEGDMNLQRFDLDDVIHDKRGRNTSNQQRLPGNVHIAARLNHRRFLRIPPSSFVELQFDNGLGSDIHANRQSIGCISSDGWILVSLELDEKRHLFYASFDGATAMEGAYYQEIAAMDYPEHRLRDKILNADLLTQISARHDPYSSSLTTSAKLNDTELVKGKEIFDKQNAIATFKLTSDKTIMITMRKSAVANGTTSSFDEIIKWLCYECDYLTAGRICLSLLNDNEGLLDLEHRALLSHGDNGEEACREGILDGIAAGSSHGFNLPRCASLKSSTTTKSLVDKKREREMTNISNTAIFCLVKGGSTLSHTLENFLGRNEFYGASSACRILVSSTKEDLKNFFAADITTAPYFLSRVNGHTLWPIRCLLRVASSRNFIDRALGMLNESIPDILRNRLHDEINRDDPTFELTVNLSMSIISMILASADNAASHLLNLVDTVTNQLYWVSLDDETRRSLSILHVHGRYPLLREFETRAWTLDLLQKVTKLKPCNDHIEINSFVKSEWLRDICTGVLCNAGCDLSHTILFTPALSTEGVKNMNMNENNMFRQMQEEEEDLYDYLEPAPQCGGIDFDLIIPALLILEKRQIHWLGNEKVPSQTILNIVCDLAGRYSLEEPKYSFDAVSAMKQCVEIGNPEAAANLIGGQNGLFLKCTYIVSKEFDIPIQEAERFLAGDFRSISCCKRKVVDDDSEFVLTNSHKSLLLLLEKHVMGIRKYGDFHCGDSRGRLNPIYAARTCLKTWLLLTTLYPSSGPWLERWLNGRLRLQTSDLSLNRLPHAAIAHALLWNSDLPDEEISTLAVSLKFSPRFLIHLAQIPCGIMEAQLTAM